MMERILFDSASTSCMDIVQPFTLVTNQLRTHSQWKLLVEQSTHSVLVLDENGEALGALLPNFTSYHQLNNSIESYVNDDWLTPITYVTPTCLVKDLPYSPSTLIVVRDENRMLGTICWKQPQSDFADNKKQRLILEAIFETAYEGIVIVDQQGRIVQMNQAYRNFIGGISEKAVIGKPVQDVIENTQLHHIVKSGMPERGKVQLIQGQKMVVHRIPLWQNEQVVGAIGMLIFEGVSELYQIMKQMSGKTEEIKVDALSPSVKTCTFEKMVGKSASLQAAKSFARKAARTTASVLITGETGTGKELFARSIHQLSARKERPFIAVNCAAMPETLLETELFGYEEGSFTGAKRGGAIGKFEQATGGTLFLDEIADMSQAMQAKLLRALETREITKVGGSQTHQVDIRLIAATNHDLEQKVEQETFRKDLYYRIHVIHLKLPSLKERKEDIPSLLRHYLDFFAHDYQVEQKEFQEEAIQTLLAYDWPGNIRELVNVVDYVMTICDHRKVYREDLPESIRLAHEPLFTHITLNQEQKRIKEALIQANGSKTKAAQLLGIHRATLYRKMKEYAIS